MKKLVTIPDESVKKIEDHIKEYAPHMSLGKFIVHCAIEVINETQGKKNDH